MILRYYFCESCIRNANVWFLWTNKQTWRIFTLGLDYIFCKQSVRRWFPCELVFWTEVYSFHAIYFWLVNLESNKCPQCPHSYLTNFLWIMHQSEIILYQLGMRQKLHDFQLLFISFEMIFGFMCSFLQSSQLFTFPNIDTFSLICYDYKLIALKYIHLLQKFYICKV